MQSINDLTPAQRTRLLIEQAKRRADRDAWEQYEEENRAHLAALRGKPRKPITHGATGYARGCRCEVCREAILERQRAYRARTRKPKQSQARGREGRTVKPEMHGTHTGYAYGCRCDRCRAARRTWTKKKRTQRHGTEYVYTLGCRCKKCTRAHTEARDRRRARAELKPLEHHGTDNGYTHYKCRCDECKKAHNEAVRIRNAERREYYKKNPHLIPSDKHGTVTGYTSYSCRCDECREAHRVSTNERRERKRNAEVSQSRED